MTITSDQVAAFAPHRPKVTKHGLALALPIALTLSVISGGAWAYWTADSAAGGTGAAGAATVSTVTALTVDPDHSSIVVQWPASTLDDGTTPVTKFSVKRYLSGASIPTAFAAGSECTGTVINHGCIDSDVPAGNWTYTVTPRFATNWIGSESSQSAMVVSDGLPPQNHVWMWVTP